MTVDAYCMKCRTTRTITDAHEHVNVRGTRMAQGPCPVCGTTVTKFLPKAAPAPQPAATPASTPASKRKPSTPRPAATTAAGSAQRGSKKSG